MIIFFCGRVGTLEKVIYKHIFFDGLALLRPKQVSRRKGERSQNGLSEDPEAARSLSDEVRKGQSMARS